MAIVYSVHYMSWCYGNFFARFMAKHVGFDKLDYRKFYNKDKGVWETAGPVCFNPRSDQINTGKGEFYKWYNLNEPINKTKIICKSWTHSVDQWDPAFKESPHDVRPVFLTIDDQDSHCYRRMVWGCTEVDGVPDYWEKNTNKVMAQFIKKKASGELTVNIDRLLQLDYEEYMLCCEKLETKPWKPWKDYIRDYTTLEGNPDV